MITNNQTLSKEPVPPLIKIREAAKFLSISRATVHALIEKGDLQASEVSPSSAKKRRHVRITRESFCGFYKKRFGQDLSRVLVSPFKS
jgi:excisionase family DNA binding protein